MKKEEPLKKGIRGQTSRGDEGAAREGPCQLGSPSKGRRGRFLGVVRGSSWLFLALGVLGVSTLFPMDSWALTPSECRRKKGCKFNTKLWKCVCKSSPRRTGRRRGPKGVKGGPMVRIRGKCFTMGSKDRGALANEKPEHRVCLSSYYIDKYEVSVADYKKCIIAGKCTPPMWHNPKHSSIKYCNWDAKGREKHPLNCVSAKQADAYCSYAGKRLPTEAEWEYAARARKKWAYPWGDELATCKHAIISDAGNWGCGRSTTWDRGSRPRDKSPFGVRDMAGNVSEWTMDGYRKGVYGATPKNFRNPVVPVGKGVRMVRGGSAFSNARNARTTRRQVLQSRLQRNPKAVPAARGASGGRTPSRGGSPTATRNQLSRSDIMSSMKRVMGQVKRCRKKYKKTGIMWVKVVVSGAGGRPASVSVTGTLAGTPLGRCVARALRRHLRFPKFKRSSQAFRYPIRIR
mgnify:CR=1 FL=1